MSGDAAAVRCRGVRGATFIDEDTPEAILAGTRELLAAIAEANGIATEDVASAFFTSTVDLRSAFPARAARDLGWTDVPLLGATEVDKPGAPPRCIRVLLHWNTSRRPSFSRGRKLLPCLPPERWRPRIHPAGRLPLRKEETQCCTVSSPSCSRLS